jgi:ribokinase
MSIVVFGSINMDLVVQTSRLPQPGETLAGAGFFTAPGGKGANQAVACARLGASTHMVGRLGNDGFGTELRAALLADGVNVTGVATDDEQPTGVALITVEASGENTIVIVAGANGAVGEAELAQLDGALSGASALLLQLEVPIAAVLAAAQRARQRGVPVILDPAPARPLPPELYQLTDVITPNESEAAALVGFPISNQADASRAAAVLRERGAGCAIIKMGAQGLVWANGNGAGVVPAFPVQAVDTVAAGDACNAGFAAALDAGLPFAEALRWGAAAGALAVTKAGAQPALPTKAEVVRMLNSAS